MRIIVISSSGNKENEPELVTKMFENGLSTFHLRKPRFSTKKLELYIKQIPKQFHSRIVLHSHHSLVSKYKLGGIHFTHSHLKKSMKNWWRNIILGRGKRNFIKTTSFSKLASLYDEQKIKFDYVFLSPIFDSLTGKYQSGFHEQGIISATQKSGLKIVARGGIDIENIEKAKELGFYGLAFYSSIWNSKDPFAFYLKITETCKTYNIPME